MKILDSILNLLNPKWLKKIDRYLLLNYPRFWVTKIHYVIYNGLLVNIVFNLFVFIFLDSTQIGEFLWYFVSFVMSCEIAILIFWFIQQSLYNSENEYCNTHYTIELLETIICIICIIIISSTSLTTTATAIYKTANVVGITSSTQCNEAEISKFKVLIVGSNSNKLYYSDDICKDIKYFLEDSFTPSNYRIYHAYYWWHIFFIYLGISLLIAKKYVSWRILALVLIYILSLGISSIFILSILHNLYNPSFSESLSIILMCVSILNAFIILQSIRLIRAKKNNIFMLINLITLPISLGVLIFIVDFYINKGNFSLSRNTLLYLRVLTLSVFLFPIYQAFEKRNIALPKE